MGIKEMLDSAREKGRERKELMRKMDEQLRVEELLQERRKSANQRELEKFMKEDKEEEIKFLLDKARKDREQDIKFNHNPLFTPNITNHTDWEVLKEKNLFAGKSNMFSNQESILKNNPKLLKGGMKLIK